MRCRLRIAGAPRVGHDSSRNTLMRPVATLMISAALLMPCALVAQTHDDHSHAAMQEDSAFRAMQARGQAVMGVDQYTSVHRFDALRDGGRIVLQRDRDDSAGAVVIRAHLRSVARAFSAGDFSSPRAVHVDTVPGTAVMRAPTFHEARCCASDRVTRVPWRPFTAFSTTSGPSTTRRPPHTNTECGDRASVVGLDNERRVTSSHGCGPRQRPHARARPRSRP